MGLIRVYQWTISPLLGPVCRYYPSCSHYGYEAVRVHGAVKGSALTAWRILRCNPWSPAVWTTYRRVSVPYGTSGSAPWCSPGPAPPTHLSSPAP